MTDFAKTAMNSIMEIIGLSKYPICPKCHGYIPSNENPGEYPGALSREDNTTEICSACGNKEAWDDLKKRGVVPPDSEYPRT